jgi:hypothetical protein
MRIADSGDPVEATVCDDNTVELTVRNAVVNLSFGEWDVLVEAVAEMRSLCK